jgi:hypothetical protein
MLLATAKHSFVDKEALTERKIEDGKLNMRKFYVSRILNILNLG